MAKWAWFGVDASRRMMPGLDPEAIVEPEAFTIAFTSLPRGEDTVAPRGAPLPAVIGSSAFSSATAFKRGHSQLNLLGSIGCGSDGASLAEPSLQARASSPEVLSLLSLLCVSSSSGSSAPMGASGGLMVCSSFSEAVAIIARPPSTHRNPPMKANHAHAPAKPSLRCSNSWKKMPPATPPNRMKQPTMSGRMRSGLYMARQRVSCTIQIQPQTTTSTIVPYSSGSVNTSIRP